VRRGWFKIVIMPTNPSDGDDRDFFRIASGASALAFGLLAAMVYSVTPVASGVSFHLGPGTGIAFVAGAVVAWLYWRLLRGLGSKDGQKPAKSRKFFICSIALLVGAFLLFCYPLKFVPPAKRGDVAFGLALAVAFLSVVAFLLWKTVKFLNADSDRTDKEDRAGPASSR